jgi:hypothetical protein
LGGAIRAVVLGLARARASLTALCLCDQSGVASEPHTPAAGLARREPGEEHTAQALPLQARREARTWKYLGNLVSSKLL